MAGTGATTLIVLRGNSASGKSTVASALRDRYGRGIAIVGQDNLRRIVLRERDVSGGAYIGAARICSPPCGKITAAAPLLLP